MPPSIKQSTSKSHINQTNKLEIVLMRAVLTKVDTVKFQSFNIYWKDTTHLLYDISVPYIISSLLLILYFPH